LASTFSNPETLSYSNPMVVQIAGTAAGRGNNLFDVFHQRHQTSDASDAEAAECAADGSLYWESDFTRHLSLEDFLDFLRSNNSADWMLRPGCVVGSRSSCAA
jgi:hypothetical protein